MKIIRSSLLLAIVLLLFSFAFTDSKAEDIVDPPEHCRNLSRSTFPAGFIFGSASAAYQYEGAAREGGRGLSIWDIYTHTHPERIADGSNGDVALDQYHRYQEDVGIMKSIGLDSYRFSISWSRVLPYGTLSGGVNQEGIDYYNDLINELIRNDINMSVTLFHWDVPQALQDQFGGFLSPQIAKHFRDYAELCFKEFGDRVKHWVTLNEPYVFTYNGYVEGSFAPGRCSHWQPYNCTGGDSSTEPYLVGHHLLISHAAAVHLYRTKYQAIQGGQIGIVLVSFWFEPASKTAADVKAASRALDFMYGWFLHPVATGDYPESMRSLAGSRLPTFTANQSALLNGSYDFLGLNYYTARYAANAPANNSLPPSFITDSQVNLLTSVDGVSIGPTPGIPWLNVHPQGIRHLLVYTKRNYNNPPIYITENGVAEMDDPTLTLEQALNDTNRINFYYHHLCNVQTAIVNESVNMQGYFAWSLLDNFEWSSGYTARFGINYVNYTDNLSRHNKLSANWLTDFLKN